MSKELELLSLDGLGGWFRSGRGHAFHLTPGQTCLNCDTELHGRYCSNCGQDADTHHRTIGHLVAEVFEGLFHFDGRLWQTLPALFLAPGRLSRDMIEGRVARHVPPLRIFLVALLVFMLAAEHRSEEARHHAEGRGSSAVVVGVDDDGDAITEADLHNPDVKITETRDAKGNVHRSVTRNIQILAMSDDDAHVLATIVQREMAPGWFKTDLLRALNNPDGFFHALFTWGHRVALLLLPIIGLLLGMLYAGKRYRRRFYLYDHLIVAMNLMSFIFFVNAVSLLLPQAWRPWPGMVTVLWTLVTFYLTLRGAYGSSVFGAIFKSLVLWVLTGFSFALVLLGVMFISVTAG